MVISLGELMRQAAVEHAIRNDGKPPISYKMSEDRKILLAMRRRKIEGLINEEMEKLRSFIYRMTYKTNTLAQRKMLQRLHEERDLIFQASTYPTLECLYRQNTSRSREEISAMLNHYNITIDADTDSLIWPGDNADGDKS